jgi:hypothetical protein
MKRPYMIDQEAKLKPSDGKAIVNFIRPSGYGKAAKATIWDGDKLIGVSFGEQRFQYECEPGKHLFLSWSEYKSPVEADLLPNRVYYVLIRIRTGWWRARMHLVPVNTQHELWEKTLSWNSSLPNYSFDMQHLAVAENESKQKILDYLRYYEDEVKGTKHVIYLRPEDGVSPE